MIIQVASINAQSFGIIKGSISDKESGEYLSGVTIRLENTIWGAITDKSGEFIIRKIIPGDYVLTASMIGYKTEKFVLKVDSGQTTNIDIILITKPFQTSEVIVTASKRIQSVQEVPMSVSVIESNALKERSVTKLDEILSYVPGVSLNGDQVSIRGSSGFAFGIGSRITFLVDGFPVISGDGGEIKFDAFPIFQAERIEVVKGSGSALYGTGALGGVINFITKKPSNEPRIGESFIIGFYTRPRFSQWNYSERLHWNYGMSGSYLQKFGKLGILTSLSFLADESYKAYDDSYKISNFTKLIYDISDKSKISIISNFATDDRTDWVFWNSLDTATKPPINTKLDNRIESDKITLFGELYQVLSADHFMIIRSGLYNTFFKNSLSENDSEYRSSNANAYNSEIQFNYLFTNKMILTYGCNFNFNNVTSKIYGNKSQNIIALYTQGEYSGINNLSLNAGFRVDVEKTNDVDRHIELSPKFGLLYHTPFDVSMRAAIGRGFRAATVAERFAAVAFQGIDVEPNPYLKSERSWSFEIGALSEFSLFTKQVNLDVSLFQYKLYDLIEPGFIEEAASRITFKNVTRARIRGVEINIQSLIFDYFGIESSLTALDALDLNLNETLNYRHKWMWYSRIFLPLGFLELQFDYRYLSRINNIDDELETLERLGLLKDADARVPIHVFDLRLILYTRKNLKLPFDITINAKNLLDYYYTEMVGNLAPTRLISLQFDNGW